MLTTERGVPPATKPLTASVVVCTASHARATLLRACVDSLLAGKRPPDELFVIVDSNPSLKAELAAALPRSVCLLETEQQGLSEARNVGIRAATSDVVAFLDDDAAGEREWLSSLMDALEADEDVLGVGGPVVPDWGAERRWLRDELLWVVGCTYRGHREDAGPIRNPIGCNMAFRRKELIAVGSFATRFGKRGNALETCDETELSLRLELAWGPGRIRYVPAARVRHFVPASRISWRLLVRRSLSEGLAKGRLHRLYAQRALGPERSYAHRLVVEAVPRLLLDGIRRRDGRLVMGAVAIVLSLLITGGAFVAGGVREGRRQARLSTGFQGNEVRPDATR
jgi:GT2 family glycosyltransferase